MDQHAGHLDLSVRVHRRLHPAGNAEGDALCAEGDTGADVQDDGDDAVCAGDG